MLGLTILVIRHSAQNVVVSGSECGNQCYQIFLSVIQSLVASGSKCYGQWFQEVWPVVPNVVVSGPEYLWSVILGDVASGLRCCGR